MTIPTFSGHAGTPDFGGSWAAGAGIGQREVESAQQFKLGREKIAADMAQAEMELSAKRAAMAQQAMAQAQELEIEKAYRQSMLGLRDRELQMQEQQAASEIESVANQFAAQQRMRSYVEDAISQGKPVGEAFQEAMALHGVGAGAPGSAFGEMMPGQAEAEIPAPIMQEMAGTGAEGFRVAKTSKNQWQVFPPQGPAQAAPVPGAPGSLEYGRRVIPDRRYRQLESEIDDIRTRLNSDAWSIKRTAYEESKDPDAELTKTKKIWAREYKAQLDELKKREEQLAEIGARHTPSPRASTNAAPGIRIRAIRPAPER
jgi:hypothetical protein